MCIPCLITRVLTKQRSEMKLRILLSGLILVVLSAGLLAQDAIPPIKVFDTNQKETIVKNASSSSSSSCNSPDFPVIKGGSRKDINFKDLEFVTVLHDRKASNDMYITVELTTKDGGIEILEMIKHIRFTGVTEEGDFSIAVKDISMVQVMHPMY